MLQFCSCNNFVRTELSGHFEETVPDREKLLNFIMVNILK